MAESIRGGIEAVPKGQMEAARSLGMSHGKAMRKVVLPQAFRIALPSLTNEMAAPFKDTSLIAILGNYLAGVKVTPEANSGLKVSDVHTAEASGQSKREELAFKLDLSAAAKGKWKLTIDNRGQQVTVDFEVQ